MTSATVVSSRRDPAWLPPGSRADVVRAAPGGDVPDPVGLVRLLVTDGAALLAVSRRHSSGLDLPTRRVASGWRDALRELVVTTIDVAAAPSLLGWVHNHVPTPDEGYEWPAPDCFFVVWRLEVPRDATPDGTWLAPRGATDALSERHWWPLLGR